MSKLKWTLAEAVVGVPIGLLLYNKPEVGIPLLVWFVVVGKLVGELIGRWEDKKMKGSD